MKTMAIKMSQYLYNDISTNTVVKLCNFLKLIQFYYKNHNVFFQLISTTLSLAGCILCTFLLGLVGKRPLALVSIGGCAISCFCLSSCSLFSKLSGSWLSITALFSLSFFTGIGMIPLPWIYMSEVFPFR